MTQHQRVPEYEVWNDNCLYYYAGGVKRDLFDSYYEQTMNKYSWYPSNSTGISTLSKDIYNPFAVGGSQRMIYDEERFTGNITEVRVWNHALSANETASYADRVMNGRETGLRLYWPMDEGLDRYVFDASYANDVPNGRHATVGSNIRSSILVPSETQLSRYENSTEMTYSPDALIGSYDTPVNFRTTDYLQQTVQLNKGWTWMSIYVDLPSTAIGDVLPQGNDLKKLQNIKGHRGWLAVCERRLIRFARRALRARRGRHRHPHGQHRRHRRRHRLVYPARREAQRPPIAARCVSAPWRESGHQEVSPSPQRRRRHWVPPSAVGGGGQGAGGKGQEICSVRQAIRPEEPEYPENPENPEYPENLENPEYPEKPGKPSAPRKPAAQTVNNSYILFIFANFLPEIKDKSLHLYLIYLQ